MLQQDFEKLLAAYFEDELDEAGLAMLAQTVQEVPKHQRRFQREVRIHTLMRESALVLMEAPEQRFDTIAKRTFLTNPWSKITAIAAAVMLLGVVGGYFAVAWQTPEKIGYCMHVSEANELQLSRNGKSLKLANNSVLRSGDRIQTTGDAQVSLKLSGVGIVTVNGSTELILAGESERVAIQVIRGKILLEAEHREEGTSPLVIQTPKAEVEVMGTVFGMEVDAVATRVRAHEGQVRFREKTTDRMVKVDAGQYCINGGEMLEALDQSGLLPGTLLPGSLRLKPTANVYTERNRILSGQHLKVEDGRRVSYLKFEIPELGNIAGARLRLKQMIDPGAGTLCLWHGNHENWSEQTHRISNLPQRLRLVAKHTGWVKLDQEIEFDVSSMIQKAGSYTIIMTLEGDSSNDVWFGSSESSHPPELILFVDAESL